MKTIFLMLLPVFMFSQTYVDLNGGIQQFTDTKPAFTVGVRHQFGDLGLKASYMFRETGYKDTETVNIQVSYIPFNIGIYSPNILGGINNKLEPVYGINNIFHIENNLNLTASYEMIDNISYISFGMSILFIPIKNKQFKPRFF